MGYKIQEKINDAGLLLVGIGVLGFIGLVFLILYGNLSGNLGFPDSSTSFVNQTINLTTGGNFPAAVIGKNNTVLSNVVVLNATSGALVPATNYTVVGGRLSATTGSLYTSHNVNVSASANFNGEPEDRAEGLITSMSGGFQTFFGFSNTLFTIAAVVVLIFMLVGLIAVIFTIYKGMRNDGEGFQYE